MPWFLPSFHCPVLFCSYSYILLGSSLEAAIVAAAWVGFRARYTQGFFFRVIRACLQQHPVHGRCDSQLLLLQVWISCRVLLLAISSLGWLGHGLMGVLVSLLRLLGGFFSLLSFPLFIFFTIFQPLVWCSICNSGSCSFHSAVIFVSLLGCRRVRFEHFSRIHLVEVFSSVLFQIFWFRFPLNLGVWGGIILAHFLILTWTLEHIWGVLSCWWCFSIWSLNPLKRSNHNTRIFGKISSLFQGCSRLGHTILEVIYFMNV